MELGGGGEGWGRGRRYELCRVRTPSPPEATYLLPRGGRENPQVNRVPVIVPFCSREPGRGGRIEGGIDKLGGGVEERHGKREGGVEK